MFVAYSLILNDCFLSISLSLPFSLGVNRLLLLPILIELCVSTITYLFGFSYSLIAQSNTTAGYCRCVFRNKVRRYQTAPRVSWPDGEETTVSNLDLQRLFKWVLIEDVRVSLLTITANYGRPVSQQFLFYQALLMNEIAL